MPINLLKDYDVSEAIKFAALNRVTVAYDSRSPVDIEFDASAYLKQNRVRNFPTFYPGSLTASIEMREYLKDVMYTLERIARTSFQIEDDILKFVKECDSRAVSISQELEQLEARLLESEGMLNGEFSFYKIFGNKINATSVLDFKTSFALSELDTCGNDGAITLPYVQEQLFPSACIFAGGYGTAGRALVHDDTRNLVNAKSWRHQYVIEQWDGIRSGSQTPEIAYLIFEWEASTTVNFIRIQSMSIEPLEVYSVEALYDDWSTLDFEANGEAGIFNIFCSTAETKAIKIGLIARSATTVEVDLGNQADAAIANYLQAAGWSQGTTYNQNIIQGKLFDFSLRRVSFFLRKYAGIGVFEIPIKAKKPLVGIETFYTLRRLEEDMNLSNQEQTSNGFDGIELYIQGIKELIPVDAQLQQREVLSLVGRVGRVRFWPDLQTGVEKVFISSIVSSTGGLLITFQSAHGFTLGEEIVVYSQEDAFCFSTTAWTAPNSTSILVSDQVLGSSLTVLAPKSYAFVRPAIPWSVYKDGVELTTLDYEWTFDKEIYSNEIDYTVGLRAIPRVGDWYIRLHDVVPGSIYEVEYPCRNQMTEVGVIRDGRLTFFEPIQDLKIIGIIRADRNNFYDSPLLKKIFVRGI